MTDEQKKLCKPCPFCGNNEDLFRGNNDSGALHFIGCASCGMQGPFFDNPDQAFNSWNARPTPEVLAVMEIKKVVVDKSVGYQPWLFMPGDNEPLMVLEDEKFTGNKRLQPGGSCTVLLIRKEGA